MKWTREKGIASASFVLMVFEFGDTIVKVSSDKGIDFLWLSLIGWMLCVMVVTPFWLLFEAIVEKIKE